MTGSSGSGKSTLLNLLGLLEPASAGEVWLGEERVSHLGRRAQARVRGASIGYVFQSFLLLSRLTALDNVVLAARYVGGDRAVARREALASSSAWVSRIARITSRRSFREGTAARRLLPRGAQPAAARAGRRADRQPRRRARAGDPGRAPRLDGGARRGRGARHAPTRDAGRRRSRAPAPATAASRRGPPRPTRDASRGVMGRRGPRGAPGALAPAARPRASALRRSGRGTACRDRPRGLGLRRSARLETQRCPLFRQAAAPVLADRARLPRPGVRPSGPRGCPRSRARRQPPRRRRFSARVSSARPPGCSPPRRSCPARSLRSSAATFVPRRSSRPPSRSA